MAAQPFQKRIGKVFTVIQSLSGAAADTVLYACNSVDDQIYYFRVRWEARDNNDLTKGGIGSRACIVRGHTGASINIIGQSDNDAPLTVGAMGTVSFNLSSGNLRANFTNDGGITGEIMYEVTLSY